MDTACKDITRDQWSGMVETFAQCLFSLYSNGKYPLQCGLKSIANQEQGIYGQVDEKWRGRVSIATSERVTVVVKLYLQHCRLDTQLCVCVLGVCHYFAFATVLLLLVTRARPEHNTTILGFFPNMEIPFLSVGKKLKSKFPVDKGLLSKMEISNITVVQGCHKWVFLESIILLIIPSITLLIANPNAFVEHHFSCWWCLLVLIFCCEQDELSVVFFRQQEQNSPNAEDQVSSEDWVWGSGVWREASKRVQARDGSPPSGEDGTRGGAPAHPCRYQCGEYVPQLLSSTIITIIACSFAQVNFRCKLIQSSAQFLKWTSSAKIHYTSSSNCPKYERVNFNLFNWVKLHSPHSGITLIACLQLIFTWVWKKTNCFVKTTI